MTREGLVFATNDEGDSYRLLFDSAAIYVDFSPDPHDPIVKLHSPLIMNVPLEGQRDRVLRRLNDINCKYRYLKVHLRGDTIIAQYAIPGRNLDGEDFARAMKMMVSLCEMLDDSLMVELGGDRSLDVLRWQDEEDN